MYNIGTCVLATAKLVEMAGDMESSWAGWQGCVVIGPNGSCRLLFCGMPLGCVWQDFGGPRWRNTLGIGSQEE